LTVTGEELETLRKQLEERRERLLAQIDYMEKGVRSERGDGSGGGRGYASHLADAGSDHTERETAAQLTAAEARLLASIDDALVRIEKGRYGTCEQCGGSIGMRRLLARPDAERCIECQEKWERAQGEGRA
jgi:RNA polymerase-binding protein DksA